MFGILADKKILNVSELNKKWRSFFEINSFLSKFSHWYENS